MHIDAGVSKRCFPAMLLDYSVTAVSSDVISTKSGMLSNS